jgi:hypothetical protein
MKSIRFTLATILAASVFTMTYGVRADQIVYYSFPTSWDGTGLDVTDLSPAGNNGTATTGAVLSATIPPSAPAGDMSLAPVAGGISTNNTDLLENPTIGPAGGFALGASFLWDGGEGTHSVQKIIDNEGTESLQLQNIDIDNGTADLQFRINDFDGPTMPIVANTWYDVQGIFNSMGNSIDGNGDLAGMATLIVNGASTSMAMTRESGDTGGMGTASDTQNRPIAIGSFSGAPSIVTFSGYIHDPSVSLLPEPASVCLLATCILAWMTRARRRHVSCAC